MTGTARPRAFHFVRHGQSVANAGGYPAGRLDSPLTEQGRAEAEALREKIASLVPGPRHIFTSSLARAQDTASILNRDLGLPVTIEQDLCEQDYGSFQGQPKGPLIEQYGPGWFAAPPGGESFLSFRDRVMSAIDRMLTRTEWPLLVGHGGTIMALSLQPGADLETVLRAGNCALLRVEYSDSAAQWRFSAL
jgi:broad specificity phosphatase PhoE